MKTKELVFDRNLVSELNKGNIAFTVLKKQIIISYKLLNPTVVTIDRLESYCKKENQAKISFPDSNLYWLANEEEEAPKVLAFPKKDSACYSEPKEWDFYIQPEYTNLTTVVGSVYDYFLRGDAMVTVLYLS